MEKCPGIRIQDTPESGLGVGSVRMHYAPSFLPLERGFTATRALGFLDKAERSTATFRSATSDPMTLEA